MEESHGNNGIHFRSSDFMIGQLYTNLGSSSSLDTNIVCKLVQFIQSALHRS
jgi:hypothetical protein